MKVLKINFGKSRMGNKTPVFLSETQVSEMPKLNSCKDDYPHSFKEETYINSKFNFHAAINRNQTSNFQLWSCPY